MQKAEEPREHCVMCNKAAELRCSKCSAQWYCGKKCQKEDWPVHKILCPQRQIFQTRHSQNVRRGILFPENEATVKFIWVPVEWVRDDDSGGFESPQLENYFGRGDNGSTMMYNYNPVRSRTLKEHIDIRHRDSFLIDGSKLNQSVLAATKGTASHTWCGPLVVLKHKAGGMDPSYYTDIDMSDFRDVVDYLIAYGRKSTTETLSEMLKDTTLVVPTARECVALREPEPSTTPRTTIKGVRINCRGDIKSKRKKFELVELPIDHRKDRHTIPAISTRVGMSLQVKKIPPPASSRKGEFSLENQAVTFLYLDDNPNSTQWGWAPMEWQSGVGSVVVARADGEDLFPQHVEALCHFCQFVLQPLFEDSMGAGMGPEDIGKEEVLYRMSAKSFELFFSGWESYKRSIDSKWIVGIPYPKITCPPEKVRGLRENFHTLSRFL